MKLNNTDSLKYTISIPKSLIKYMVRFHGIDTLEFAIIRIVEDSKKHLMKEVKEYIKQNIKINEE